MELTTRRCVLRPVTADDAPALHELWSSRGVRRFLWDDEIMPVSQTEAAIERSQKLFPDANFGLWVARRHDGPHLIGFAGLWQSGARMFR